MMSRLIRIVTGLVVLTAVSASAQTDEELDRQARRQKVAVCRALLKTALNSMDEGQFDDADRALDSVLICDPDNPDAYYHKARIALHGNAIDSTVALDALSTGVSKAPRSSRLKLFLARLHIAQGRHDQADSLVSAVLAIKPREGEALYLKSIILLNNADTAQALEQVYKAFESVDRRSGL